MNRQSARKIKLTSKFEDFTTTRLASIQRLANTKSPQNAQPASATEIVIPAKAERASTIKVERESVRSAETSKAAEITPNHASSREKTPHKVLRQHKAATLTPATPTPETPQPSTPYGHITPLPKLTANGKIRGRPRKCWQKAETVVKPVSTAREELLRLREENTNLKSQLEQKTAEYDELKRQSSYTGQTVPKVDYDDLKEKYQRDLAHAKRHEWCVVCLTPSRYYCCWNTTYCSQKCQVSDWYGRHIKSCERRRAIKSAVNG